MFRQRPAKNLQGDPFQISKAKLVPTTDTSESEAETLAQIALQGTGARTGPSQAGHELRRADNEAANKIPEAPIPDPARRFFESCFNHDFGKVRVHSGDRADSAARLVQAQAYTVGSDIVFAKGEYAPSSERGRALIAHELAHVVQNDSNTAAKGMVRRKPSPSGQSISERVDEIVDRLEGYTDDEDGNVIVATFRSMSADEQKQALEELRRRATSMHESREGPLFRLFEDVSDRQRDELARILYYSGAMSQQELARFYAGRTLAGRWLPVTTQAGSDLAQYGADMSVQGQKEGGASGVAKQVAGVAIGVPAALWTPETATETVATVTILRAAKPLVAAFPRAAGIPMAAIGGGQTGISIGALITGVSMSGEPLTDEDRLRHWLMAGSGIVLISAGIMSTYRLPGLPRARSSNTLTPEETAKFLETHEVVHTTPEGIEVWAPRGTPAQLPVPSQVPSPVPPPPTRVQLRLSGTSKPTAAQTSPTAQSPVPAPRRAAAPPAAASPGPSGSRAAAALQGVTPSNSAAWLELRTRAGLPVPRQSTGGFRSNSARQGNREVRILEGRVGPQIGQQESVAKYSEKLSGEHGTHGVGMQLGENLFEGITSAPASFNTSEMKILENAIRETANQAALYGASTETRTILMIEYSSQGGTEVPILVGVERQAWLVLPLSHGGKTIPFVDFAARLDPTSRAVVVTRNSVKRPE